MPVNRTGGLVAVTLAGLSTVVCPQALAQCGSAVLGEKAMPAVFQGITLGPSTVARAWPGGQLSAVSLTAACDPGCRSFTASPLCDGDGDCTAVSGIEWLNAACGTPGYLPQSSVLLLEAPTAGEGGRWAAIRVGRNAGDANFDLDAAAASICGPSCATLASPYVGGPGQGVEVISAAQVGSTLTVKVGWLAPSPAAQALNQGGSSLVTGYSLYFARSTNSGATPPVLTGEKTGWTWVADTDSRQLGGHSTDTRATLAIPLGASSEAVYLAIGLAFDGTGNPDGDANTARSNYISRGVRVYRPSSPAPVVTSVVPVEGPVDGGQTVVVTGTRLTGVSSVTVDGAPATDVTVTGSTRLRATVPAGAAGTADVVVSGSGGSWTLVDGYRYRDVAPAVLGVDEEQGAGTTGNLNGVLEPGEVVTVAPAWTNLTGGLLDLSGHAGGLIGPSGATYTTVDTAADYGDVAVGVDAGCSGTTGDCYAVGVSAPSSRPASHWDLRFVERLSTGETVVWSLHVGSSFGDVLPGHWAYRYVETMLHEGVTAGCGGGSYCPSSPVAREQMAVFLLKAFEGETYVPPPCGGIFGDVPCPSTFADWIEELAARQVTSGCGPGVFCPSSVVNREQMAVFLLKTKHGGDYEPPDCEGMFSDVTCPSQYADWIEELVRREITAGCGGGNYCPLSPVSRDQMAVFLTRTFGLVLHGAE